MNPDLGVADHYSAAGLGARLLATLAEAGTPAAAGGFDDLPPIDEMHIRGREGTDELAARGRWKPALTVLDAGSGLGGSARYLAVRHACEVVGVDLTGDLCHAARDLSLALGITTTRFVRGSATELPVADASFDVVWTQHAQMNIADKHGFYGELERVLKPGGQLLFHDVFEGPIGPPHFPVPWAGSAAISALADPAEVARILHGLDLRQLQWQDRSEASLGWARSVASAIRDPDAPNWRHLIMGARGLRKMQNLARNLEQSRIVVAQASYEKPAL